MNENAGAFSIINNSVESSEVLNTLHIPAEGTVYEVIRVINKVPLFFEDHFARFMDSLKMRNMDMQITQPEMKDQIRVLIEKNSLSDCNVEVLSYIGDKKNILFHVSKSHYPGKEEIQNGIKVSLMDIERQSPNAKVASSDYRKKIEAKKLEAKSFEVLLVNKNGKITEASKSNVFFVKGDKVYTSPGEYVLKGIMRKYILEACEKLGLEVIITLIGQDSLKDMDGIFLSGTSIKVLPVSYVDDFKFQSSSNKVITSVRNLFDLLIEEYIKKNQNK